MSEGDTAEDGLLGLDGAPSGHRYPDQPGRPCTRGIKAPLRRFATLTPLRHGPRTPRRSSFASWTPTTARQRCEEGPTLQRLPDGRAGLVPGRPIGSPTWGERDRGGTCATGRDLRDNGQRVTDHHTAAPAGSSTISGRYG